MRKLKEGSPMHKASAEKAKRSKRAVALRMEGFSIAEVAEIMGVHRKSVVRYTQGHDFSHRTAPSTSRKEEVRELFGRGFDRKQIEEKLGVSKSTVNRHLVGFRHAVPNERPKPKPKPEKKPDPKPKKVSKRDLKKVKNKVGAIKKAESEKTEKPKVLQTRVDTRAKVKVVFKYSDVAREPTVKTELYVPVGKDPETFVKEWCNKTNRRTYKILEICG